MTDSAASTAMTVLDFFVFLTGISLLGSGLSLPADALRFFSGFLRAMKPSLCRASISTSVILSSCFSRSRRIVSACSSSALSLSAR